MFRDLWNAAWKGDLAGALRELEGNEGTATTTNCNNVVNVVNRTGPHGQTPLHAACRHGHVAIVKALLQHGADAAIGDEFGTTPLHVAVVQLQDQHERSSQNSSSSSKNARRIVRALLESAANNGGCGARDYDDNPLVRAVDHTGATPLHAACKGGGVKIVRRLLKAGARLDALDRERRTPLAKAAQWGGAGRGENVDRGRGSRLFATRQGPPHRL